jgi:hypothetical protein
MNELHLNCPDCQQAPEPANLGRRAFIRVLGGAAAVAGLGVPAVRRAGAEEPAAKAKKAEKPGEALIRELHATMTPEQKKELVLPWDHVQKGQSVPTRLRMFNSAIEDKIIEESYTKPQQELVGRILRSICSDDEGYARISRNGNFDGSGSLGGCGAILFGEPVEGQKYSWVFAGHHLTVRCDGNSEEGAAFGGPMYYGHSPNGYSDKNVFNFQTKRVLEVYDALSEDQRKKAEADGSPGEQLPSVQFRSGGHPGIAYAELSKDQQSLVEQVMRDVLSPYRKEDADEVMSIVKANGGMEKIHLAFYKDGRMRDSERWHFWRLEGPGFVWNYRVLPHVHTFVNISSKV